MANVPSFWRVWWWIAKEDGLWWAVTCIRYIRRAYLRVYLGRRP